MSAAGHFAERLKTLREGKGLSQYALAKLTGLSKQAVSRLEQGDREPSWSTVQLLAVALDVDCRAFADPGVTLPASEPLRPRGRPAKREATDGGRPGTEKRARRRRAGG
jgi:transcriptional regulator with XRE-family HTH domain